MSTWRRQRQSKHSCAKCREYDGWYIFDRTKEEATKAFKQSSGHPETCKCVAVKPENWYNIDKT